MHFFFSSKCAHCRGSAAWAQFLYGRETSGFGILFDGSVLLLRHQVTSTSVVFCTFSNTQTLTQWLLPSTVVCLAIRNNARPIFFSSLTCYNLIYAGVQGSEVNFNIRLSFVVFVFWGSYCTLLFALLYSSFCPFKVTLSCDGLHSTSPPLYYTVTPSETSPLIKSGLCQPPSHALAPHLPTTPATRALLRLKLSPELHPANEHCQVTGGGGSGRSSFTSFILVQPYFKFPSFEMSCDAPSLWLLCTLKKEAD